MSVPDLNLRADPVELTAALVDIRSVSGDESLIADAVEAALRAQTRGFEISRFGNRVLARTHRNLPTRVVLAGHLDTVPIAGNVPSRRTRTPDEGDVLLGCGTVDMKSGLAVFLHLAATLDDPVHDLTLICYDCEEIAAEHNGLGFIEREKPDWLAGDVAVLGEPTGGLIEAGCQGTLRVRLTAEGTRAHSARAWMGENAVHKLADALTTLREYVPRSVDIDGCRYREGLTAVGIGGGVAGNVVPDQAHLDVNFRFAPDRSQAQAFAHVREVFAADLADGVLSAQLTDSAPGALPGLRHPAAAALVAAAGGRFRAKYGWTDVARFSALGVPAVNLGPGDPSLAHRADERVPVDQIREVTELLRGYLSAPAGAGGELLA
ncbi:succinyl-diaminopimelate desuccinylase [Gordonia hirsuta DSM 44140 = NBRC 16056]|uniref:Succinyl-diaminopimelate desuccinylase n=1 Tax=Gordonia hirsuta DSM 44140 = NBRC 16056 TaxID=1121927 RepID=L7L502_9ACTN|nr:succinyl-diaminopimelate desuccinylase [Gordonia hirsuta]GAC56225.1 succinyl-diaminopimelate desuccinylase [Gordonia hirsuta DSM 44140 = NBRC 16056]